MINGGGCMAMSPQRISNNSGPLTDSSFFFVFLTDFLVSIKNMYRTNSSQANINSLIVLCSKSIVLEVIYIYYIIKGFVFQKERKNYLYK
jgi:hypothetical protein